MTVIRECKINSLILFWSNGKPCEHRGPGEKRIKKKKGDGFLLPLLLEPGSSLLTSSFITFLIVMVINWHY